jgi:hypothetical protein
MRSGFFIFFALFIAVALVPMIGLGADDDIEEYGKVATLDDMITSRYNHTATQVDDDMVLVTGGTQDGIYPISSCEIYDESVGWASIDDMFQSRMRHDASVIPETEKVMVTGGWIGKGHPSLFKHYNGSGNYSLTSTEILDLPSVTWIRGPELNNGRFWHRSAVTDNGELIVIGGLNVTTGALSSCEVYRNGQWVEFAQLPIPLARYELVTLEDGGILVMGGHDGRMKTGSNQCFKLVNDEWIEVAPMNKGRGYFSGTLLPDGRVVVTGGFSVHGQPDHMDGEIYDPVSDTWTLISEMAFPRHNHATVLSGDDVVIIGGSNCVTGGCHSGIEVYDVKNDEWRDAFHIVLGRKWAHVTPLPNGSVLINGGKVCDDSASRTELFISPGDGNDETDDGEIAFIVFTSAIVISILLILRIAGFRYQKARNEFSHLATLVLGGLVMFLSHPLLLPLYIVLVIFTLFWFWANICTHCYAWGSKVCPSGHGIISSRFFKKAEKPNFRKAFIMNIWSVALQWFVPFLVGVGFLILEWDLFLLVSLVLFSLIGFVILPLTSRKEGCRNCPQRKDCPFSGAGSF